MTSPDWLRGYSTYYNRCYTIGGHGCLCHKINTKIETILLHAQGPKWDHTVAVSGLHNNLQHVKTYNHFLIDKFNYLFKENMKIKLFKIKRTSFEC